MVNHPVIVWPAAILQLGSGALLLAAAVLEGLSVDEEGSVIIWAVLAAGCLVHILTTFLLPMAARWTSALGWLVSGGTGLIGVGAGFMYGVTGVFDISWAVFAGLAALFASFMCFVTLPFVHAYRNELEDLLG